MGFAHPEVIINGRIIFRQTQAYSQGYQVLKAVHRVFSAGGGAVGGKFFVTVLYLDHQKTPFYT